VVPTRGRDVRASDNGKLDRGQHVVYVAYGHGALDE